MEMKGFEIWQQVYRIFGGGIFRNIAFLIQTLQWQASSGGSAHAFLSTDT
jgi:hypothetical protein